MAPYSSAPHMLEAMSRDQFADKTMDACKLAFLAVSARLSTIQERILTEVYTLCAVPTTRDASGVSNKTAKLIDTILGIESMLEDFICSLPSHLSWRSSDTVDSSSAKADGIYHIQRNVLHAR